MFEHIGTWPPAIAMLAILVYGLKVILDFLLSRSNRGTLPRAELTQLNVTMKSVVVAMTKISEQTHDLHSWHDADDPDGRKRWWSDPKVKEQVGDLHKWGLAEKLRRNASSG